MLCKLLALLILMTPPLFSHNVGLLIMATGKYLPFAEDLIASAHRYFLPDHTITFFVFTDGYLSEMTRNDPSVISIYQKRLGWPYDTMKRFHVYDQHRTLLSKQDFLFACDADCLMVNTIGDEILGARVGVLHAGFLDTRGTYETNPQSLACIHNHEGEHYFCGGFYGGTSEEVLIMAETISQSIDMDLARGIIAVWHDESFLNRYFIDHKPTIILPVTYCIGENHPWPLPKKLLALQKDHQRLRE